MKDRILYNYFNLTDDQMRRDHTWTGDYPAASQDFIQELKQEVQSGTMEASVAQDLLNATGLSAETSENTADSIAAVRTCLQRGLAAQQSPMTFRFTSSLGSTSAVMKAALSNSLIMNNNVQSVKYEYSTDTRQPDYTLVTVYVTYGL